MTADLALAAEPGFLERSADPAEFVIQACERAKTWLREALDHGDIDQIVEVKSQAEAVRVYTMQKQLGKDAQISATEIVRRAERGMGLAIRKAQDSGDLNRPGTHEGNQYTIGTVHQHDSSKPKVTDFASKGELYGGGRPGGAGIFHLTDDVSNQAFEEAVEEAKADGDLSRASLARRIRAKTPRPRSDDWIPEPGDNHGEAPVQRRKLIRAWAEKGYSSRQMAQMLGGMRSHTIREIGREMGVEIAADAIIGKTRIHDSSRIVRETVHGLEGFVMGLDLVNFDDLDPAEVSEWTASLADSTRRLSRFIRQLKETVQ